MKSTRIKEWYPYVSLFPDLLCNIGLSVSGLRKIRFNAYTLRRISTKYHFPNKPGFPLSALIVLVWYPYVSSFPNLLCYRLECQRFTQNTFQRLYTPSNFHKKNQFPNKPGFPLSALIILHWSNVDRLLFKKESRKNRIMINRVCLAMPTRATITWKKLRS